jgi:putative endonuclease
MDAKLLGRWGEQKAAEYLKRKKFEIIGLNYRCRFGEIDIIAKNGKYIVFVEVKLRKSADFAQAAEYVTYAKRQRLLTTAELYLSENPAGLQPRFDIIEIYAPEGTSTRELKINHIENAFLQGV